MQNLPDIKNQLGGNDLFQAFKRQLVKDFEQSNFSTDFGRIILPLSDNVEFVPLPEDRTKPAGSPPPQLFS